MWSKNCKRQRQKQKDSEAKAIIQVRGNGGSHQSGSSGESKMLLDSGYILKGELKEIPDRLKL